MENKIKADVVILCGGKGTRLKRITGRLPKSLMMIRGRPFLDFVIGHMYAYGFRRFVLATGYRAKFIEDYYNSKKLKQISILFSREGRQLGTGGAVKNTFKKIKSRDFFVLNGDTFTDFNPVHLLRFHRRYRSLITILLKKVQKSKDFGGVEMESNFFIKSFEEKKIKKSCLANGGVYVFSRNTLRSMPTDAKFSLEHDYFPVMASYKKVRGFDNKGSFIDIGVPYRYFWAKKNFSMGKTKLEKSSDFFRWRKQ